MSTNMHAPFPGLDEILVRIVTSATPVDDPYTINLLDFSTRRELVLPFPAVGLPLKQCRNIQALGTFPSDPTLSYLHPADPELWRDLAWGMTLQVLFLDADQPFPTVGVGLAGKLNGGLTDVAPITGADWTDPITMGRTTNSIRVCVFTLGRARVVGSVDMSNPALYGGGGTLDGLDLSPISSNGGAAVGTLVAPADEADLVTQLDNTGKVRAAVDAEHHLVLLSTTNQAQTDPAIGAAGTISIDAGPTADALGFTGGASATDGRPRFGDIAAGLLVTWIGHVEPPRRLPLPAPVLA